jgi:hypothetical protein
VVEQAKKNIKYRLSIPFLLSKTGEGDTTLADSTMNDTSFLKEPKTFSEEVDIALKNHQPPNIGLVEDEEEKDEQLPKTLDDQTRRSIRSNRATWFMMPRTSITSLSEQNTSNSNRARGTDDLSWFNLHETEYV